MAAGTLAIAAPNAWGSYDFVIRPETGVRDVNRRVQYMTWVQERLHIDRITVLDVDMGAHMWFSGWRIMDIAGLVDIRMGHHNYQKDFMREYIFQEMKPDFVHSHGGWSRKTKINNFPEFKREYIEIPGYPAGRKAFHMGNHVARRHLTTSRYDGPMGRQVTFEGGVTLAGWAIPSPQVPVEGKFHLQTWWKAEDRETGFRMLVFLADEDGHVRVQDAGAGYDFLPVEHWRDEEWVYGHYDIEIPEDFPRGDYKVGLVLLDEETGQVMLASRATGQPSLGPNDPDGSPATAKPRRYKLARQRHVEDAGSQDSAEPNTPAPRDQPTVYMQGELILDASLAVVTRKQALEQAANDFELALHKATQGNCEESWAAWKDAKRHVIRNTRWHNDNVPAVNSAIARCYVDRASHEQDRFAQAELYKLAALHQYDAPVLLAAARPLAAQLMQEGEAFRQEKDWESCYKYFDTAVGIDPRLSMARRRAEECRDWRLDIPGADRKVEKKPSSKSKKKTGTKNGKTTRTSRSSKKNKNEEPEENQEADDQATPPASPRPERTIKVDIKETDPARDRPFPPGGMPPLPHVLDPTHGPPPGPVPEPTEQAEPVEGPEAG